MEKAKNLIVERINALKNIDTNEDSVQFIKMFDTTVSSLCNMDFIDIITCFYMVKMDTTLCEAIEARDKISSFLEDIDQLEYEDVLSLVDNFYELQVKYNDKLKEYTYDEYMALRGINETLFDTKKMLKSYISEVTKEEINEFLKWMNNDDLSDIICLGACLKGIKINIEKTAGTVNDLEIPDFLGSKLTRKLTEGYVNDVRSSYIKEMNKELKKDIEELRSYKEKIIQDNTSLKRNINKKIKNLEELVSLIDNDKVTEENLLKLTDDEEIIFNVLVEIIKDKNKTFSDNYVCLENYRKNPINILEKIFHDYNYNFNLLTGLEQKQLMSFGNEEIIKENLSFISSSSLKFLKEEDFVFVDILLLDIDSLTQLDSLVSREKINKEFILKYGKLLNSLMIKIIVRNINKFDVHKVNIEELLKYNDSLVMDINMRLFDMITAYNIDFKSPNLKCFEFLENSKLLNIIDNFIEIGLYSQIRSLPNLITPSSSLVVKRILLMNELGVNCINDHNTINQMARQGKEFYVGDDLLNDFVYINYNNFMDEEMYGVLESKESLSLLSEIPSDIAFIEEFKKNEQVYMIGSMCFSRIKVLRCLKTLIDNGFTNYNEMLFNVLIYNYPNYLSIETIEELKNLDKNILKKQLK